METIAISRLGRSLLYPETRCINAIVTLIWPYSSSTQSFALLLAEPDFRLRNKKGQVLVRFQGASAAVLARARIASGDEINLHLEGVQWLDADPGITTPGRSVDTELLFKRKLVCQILRDGQELANIHVEDDIVSERSRSPHPSTPTGRHFAYANPRLSELNDLSTPASSAFHKRARVSGGALVDSPYDPFVRREGEPERKKARHSWGVEARWKVEGDVPSPTKENRTTDWIQDEELLSPSKPSQRSTPIKESQPPVFEPSSIAARSTEDYTHELRAQHNQELMDQFYCDTEEDTDMEGVQASAVFDRMRRDRSYESPLRQSFSVFRDSTFASNNEGVGEPMAFETEVLPGFSETLNTALLQQEEDSFFNLPSSDSIEALESVEKGTILGVADDERSFIAFQRTSSLARELLESDEVDDDEIERQARRRSAFGIESQERQQSQGENSGVERLGRNQSEREENSREELDSEAPIVEEVESENLQRRQNFRSQQAQRQLQVRQEEEIESFLGRSSGPTDGIDPTLHMAPPSLPLIQTSNFDSDLVASMAAPSRPRSPKTPDLRPQQSAALPLPSPFPGDDLATSYVDDGASDWQPSQGFMVPLRKSLPGFGFGFGFESDGLDRRYSTEVVVVPDTNNIAEGKFELPEQQLAATLNTKSPEPEVVPKANLESTIRGGKLLREKPPNDSSFLEASSPKDMLEAEVEAGYPLVDIQPDPILHKGLIHTQMSHNKGQTAFVQVIAEIAGAEMAGGDIPDADIAEPGTGMLKIEANEDAARYPEVPPIDPIFSYASQANVSEVEHVPDAPNFTALQVQSSDSVMEDRVGSEHAAYDKSEEDGEDEVMALTKESGMMNGKEDKENKAEGSVRGQSTGMSGEEIEREYSQDEKGVEHEYSDDEESDEEEGGVLIGPDHRFGPPLSTSAGPSKSAREVISLLSDSDDNSSMGGDSDLESVDGDKEEARVSRTNLIDDDVKEESEENGEDEEASESELDDYNEDDDARESSGTEDDDDPDQDSRMHGLEPSGSQYIPSFDGANDSPPSSSSVPTLMSEDRFSSSVPTLHTSYAGNLAPYTSAPINDRGPSSTAPLAQTRKTVVIELGSDSEEDTQNIPSTVPLPTIKHELLERTEIKDTYQPSYDDDEPMEDRTPADVTDDYVSAVDERFEDQFMNPSQDEQQQAVPETQKLLDQRPAVTFAPRVSRRRALGGSQPTTQLEHQSSQALASSQDTFKRPRLMIQDTFEGMVHSDGSVTTAPPSSRGHDSETTTDNEHESPITQIKVSTDHPSHSLEEQKAQSMSSSPPMISDAYPDDQDLNPNLRSEVIHRPQQSSRRQTSRLQQSIAESTLVTPDTSQSTQSQPSFPAHVDQGTVPPTPKLTQTTSNFSRKNQQSCALQQGFDEDFQEYEKFNLKLEKAVARAKTDVAPVEQWSQDESEALAATLNRLKHDEICASILEESGNSSQKMRASSRGSPSNLDTWLSPRKPKLQFQPASEMSFRSIAKLDLSLSPRKLKLKHHYQLSPPPQAFEDEPMPESQTLRRDRFDSEGVEFDMEDDILSSKFDTVNSRVSMSPTPKHQKLMAQSLKDELKGKNAGYPSSQLSGFKFSQGQPSQTKGLVTSWGYYTPVSNLMTKVSTQASQFPDNLADVIAVVAKSSTRPLRAESGPKDYVVEFLISDEDFWPNKVSVKIYRPWKPALPALEDGDPILLRSFNVLPTKKGVGLYMRSNESSSWCAWKFNLTVENNLSSDDDQPTWSQNIRAGKELTLKDREVCTAAEAQRGDEEREFVQELRKWWINKG
ncbi:hypothetical protein E2P81_ATG02260 [Venturia nashicola]|uniref:Telomeric single stranded DNA binding POT1/Cdc13 domain-containing protein n=1 Tax=Venturia nashicola TaxID=86259 RepID=A0A4Z1P372_9PEZI|nr:hypothetical protein E6O75_ATG02317 [Venturia nashicola]TLD35957.1 hypothetical protein E2P81_ATG02260 [Venturia nashicola]